MKAPRSIRWPLSVHPTPFPADPPPAIALIKGVITLSVNVLIKVLNASATTRPTAMTIRSPCMRKFLKPRSIPGSFPRWHQQRRWRDPASLLHHSSHPSAFFTKPLYREPAACQPLARGAVPQPGRRKHDAFDRRCDQRLGRRPSAQEARATSDPGLIEAMVVAI